MTENRRGGGAKSAGGEGGEHGLVASLGEGGVGGNSGEEVGGVYDAGGHHEGGQIRAEAEAADEFRTAGEVVW